MPESIENFDNQIVVGAFLVVKELRLIIQPKVIDHLGIKMYQKPVDVIAEFISNAWDADSEGVEIGILDLLKQRNPDGKKIQGL